jgi:hypothetical protein
MRNGDSLPLGHFNQDPPGGDVDPIARILERLQTLLIWIDEHHSSFLQLRQSDPTAAESELNHLRSTSDQAVRYLNRLTQLLMASGAIDPNKALPAGLCSSVWLRLVDVIQRGRKGTEADSKKDKQKGDIQDSH